MSGKGLSGRGASSEIKARLRLLNALNAFVSITLLVIVLGSLYAPVSGYISGLPRASMTAIIVIVLVLMAVGLYLSRVLTGQVLGIIGQYSRKLGSILSLTSKIKEEIYGDILLEKIMDCSVDLTDSAGGCVLLVEGEGLTAKAARGRGFSGAKGSYVPLGMGIAGRVASSGIPEAVSADGDALEGIKGAKASNALCVPLTTRSGVIGVVLLANKRVGEYGDGDIELASYLAEQAAISVERAGFFEDQRNYEVHMTDILVDTIDHMIPENRGHSKRVAKYSNVLARALDMSEADQRRLHFAGLLHDIGYLRSPFDDEFATEGGRRHAVAGYEMLKQINFYTEIAPFVLHHHERFDGQGYPMGLMAEGIPLESRIIAVGESFDALVGKTASREGVDYEAALEALKDMAGSRLDPRMTELFMRDVRGII